MGNSVSNCCTTREEEAVRPWQSHAFADAALLLRERREELEEQKSPRVQSLTAEQTRAGLDLPRLQLTSSKPSDFSGCAVLGPKDAALPPNLTPRRTSPRSPRSGSKMSTVSVSSSVASFTSSRGCPETFRCALRGAWAVIVLCAPVEGVEEILQVGEGEVAVCCIIGGGASKASGSLEGAIAAVEFAIASDTVTDVVVLQPRGSEVVQAAIREAQERVLGNGNSNAIPLPQVLRETAREALEATDGTAKVLKRVIDSRSKRIELGKAVDEKLVEFTIDTLLEKSQPLRMALRSKRVNLKGALLDIELRQACTLDATRRQEKLLATLDAGRLPLNYEGLNQRGGAQTERPRRARGTESLGMAPASARDYRVPSKSKPSSVGPAPAEEVLATLVRGNCRAAEKFKKYKGKENPHGLTSRSMMLGVEGRNPAVIFHSFKEKTPVDVIFDSPSGGLLSLSLHKSLQGDSGGTSQSIEEDDNLPANVGDSNITREAFVSSAEYSIRHHKTLLLVVLGHYHGGDAITSQKSGLEDIREGIQESMRQLLTRSAMIRNRVAEGAVQLLGAVFHAETFEVEWLGPHPNQEKLCEKHREHLLELQEKEQLEVRRQDTAAEFNRAMERLRFGNCLAVVESRRGIHTTLPGSTQKDEGTEAVAVVLSSALPPARAAEHVFASKPGELFVQRTCGAICGRQGDDVQASLEYLVATSGAPMLLVLSDVHCPALQLALRQAQEPHRATASRAALGAQAVLDQLSPAISRARSRQEFVDIAQQQIQATDVDEAADCHAQLMRLAAESSVRYTVERLLLDSAFLAERVRNGTLELQAAYVEDSGEVTFLGRHPEEAELLCRQKVTAARML